MKQNRILSSLVIFSGVFVILSTLLISSASAGNSVKVENRQLLTDFDGDGKYEPFFVKGVGYAPVPIGKFFARDTTWSGVCSYTGYYPLHFPALRFERDSPDANNAFSCTNGSQFYTDSQILDRDFSLIAAMKANTIRTWDKVTPQILQKANAHGLKVIAGYWMNHDIDYTFPDDPNDPIPVGAARRQSYITDYVNYVNSVKRDPNYSAVLLWGSPTKTTWIFAIPVLRTAA